MNFEDYEREHYARYAEFAEIVVHILSKAIEASGLPRPQSIQHRAKNPKSLKARLEQSGKLGSDTLEAERRDLAGVRVIFYTNTDVDRFLNSRIIVENFEIERDATRVHHPTVENEDRRYRAIHYTIRLKDDRAKLPEYSKFNGMRCEIQIHTILNHAWSEGARKGERLYVNLSMMTMNLRLHQRWILGLSGLPSYRVSFSRDTCAFRSRAP
jgi:ppGpp synthetase/RelA/SpoT-type nucleotidyltranferase